MADKATNPANEQWAEVSKTIGEVKSLFETYKAANDEDSKSAGEKMAKLESITTDLETRFKTVEAKLTRQKGYHAANEEMSKGMEDFNKCRVALGKKAIEENDAADYCNVYEKFLRVGGETHRMEASEIKTLEEGRDPNGGYWVLPQMSARVIEKEWETSPMAEVATVETTQTDRYGYFVDFDEFDADYIAELKARQPSDTAKIAKLYIDIHTVYAKIPTSNEILEDASVNVTAWLTRKINNKIVRIRNNNYINGSGSGEEQGILAAPAPASGAGVFGEVERIATTNAFGAGTTLLDYNDFLKLFGSLKNAYHGNASLLMSRQLLFNNVFSIKDNEDRYIVDIFNRPDIPMMLAGFPIKFMQDMSANTAAANLDIVAFGDMREAYTIVNRRGVSVLRDPYTLDGGVYFKVDSRGGGHVTNSEAYKILRTSS